MTASVGRSAVLSSDSQYRYRLDRTWSALEPSLSFVMLNPSTADAEVDDPTIRRCMGFARREGFGGITVVNLYALRATDPREIGKSSTPVGPDNPAHQRAVLEQAAELDVPVVCAWGTHGGILGIRPFERIARETGARLVCLGTTKNGAPRHPLYVRGDMPLTRWPT